MSLWAGERDSGETRCQGVDGNVALPCFALHAALRFELFYNPHVASANYKMGKIFVSRIFKKSVNLKMLPCDLNQEGTGDDQHCSVPLKGELLADPSSRPPFTHDPVQRESGDHTSPGGHLGKPCGWRRYHTRHTPHGH